MRETITKKDLFHQAFLMILYASIILCILCAIAFFVTNFENKIGISELCLSNNCFKNLYHHYEFIIKFFVSSIQLIASVATAIGIVVAVFNYHNTADNNALNNHISHFKIFSEYLVFEVSKRDYIHISSINIFDWYNLIFKDSIHGSTHVSSEYRAVLDIINSEIEITNLQVTTAEHGPHRYSKHHARMIKVLPLIGISLQNYPKNDFLIIEGEILDLINTLNKAFCHKPSNVKNLIERKYV